MKILQINTTQNVKINFEIANIGQRLLAFIVDNVIKFAYIYFITKVFDFSLINDTVNGDYWSAKAIDVLFFLPITFYSLYSEILMNGQTIGKKILEIRVVNADGFRPSILDHVIRWFLRLADFNLFILIVVYASSLETNMYVGLMVLIFIFGKTVGLLFIVFTKGNQRIGDIAANTVVVYLKDSVKFSETILENITEDYIPTYPNVIKLSDNDARIIKDTFSIVSKTKDYKTLIKLRSKIIEVTGIKPKGETDLVFIDKVLKDYNFYTKDM